MSPEPSFTQKLREEGFIDGSDAVNSDSVKEEVEKVVDNKVDEITEDVEKTVNDEKAEVEKDVDETKTEVSNSLKATDSPSGSSIPTAAIIVIVLIILIILLMLLMQ